MPGCIRKTWTKTKQLMASHKMMLPLGLTYSAKIQWIVTFPAISLSHACVPLYYPLHEILHTYSESTERKLLIMPLPYSCRRMANFIYLFIKKMQLKREARRATEKAVGFVQLYGKHIFGMDFQHCTLSGPHPAEHWNLRLKLNTYMLCWTRASMLSTLHSEISGAFVQ